MLAQMNKEAGMAQYQVYMKRNPEDKWDYMRFGNEKGPHGDGEQPCPLGKLEASNAVGILLESGFREVKVVRLTE